jgi:saccharopine dehydrogenase-like NADP-dependent oxidoreductase
MKKITVLGAGMVGSAIAADLCKDFAVTAADAGSERLDGLKTRGPIRTERVDLSDAGNIRQVIRDADLVVGALPGFMGFQALKTVIECGKDAVDISFFGEDPFGLDGLAKEKNVTAVVDCGVAPGMSNMILGFHAARMSVESFECLVGGLPFERTLPFQYKAPFSPADVLEEYTRPARIVENGIEAIRPALSESEFVEFEGVGTLEAFNTDGLRTLIRTTQVPYMKEKTLRYPGHADAVRILRDCGFLNRESLDVGGASVRPIDVAAKLLFPKWKLGVNEPEFTVMRITLRGKENGTSKEIVYSLFDRNDEKTRVSSMARTTGYACTAAARLILAGRFREKGIVPPERIGARQDCLERIMEDLKSKGVIYRMKERNL